MSMRKNASLFLATALCCFLGLSLAGAPQAHAGDGTCEGDVTGDGFVFVNDLILVIMNFGCEDPKGCEGDANGDGTVDVMDLLAVVLNFGPCDGKGCSSPADCDDGDECTFDLCVAGNCLHVPAPNPDCGGDGE